MKLEEYRKNKNLNYDELAEHLGLRRSTSYDICKERVNCVSLRNAQQIVAKTFGQVGFEDLLWGDCR